MRSNRFVRKVRGERPACSVLPEPGHTHAIHRGPAAWADPEPSVDMWRDFGPLSNVLRLLPLEALVSAGVGSLWHADVFFATLAAAEGIHEGKRNVGPQR